MGVTAYVLKATLFFYLKGILIGSVGECASHPCSSKPGTRVFRLLF